MLCSSECGRVSSLTVCILESAVVLQDFVRRKHKHIPIEVETRTLDEVRQVLQFLETDKHSLVKRLMLDNMTKLDPSAPGNLVRSMLSVLLNCHNTSFWYLIVSRCKHSAVCQAVPAHHRLPS